MPNSGKRTKKGFTVSELVIVIAVIGILASVMIPLFAGSYDKTDLSSDKQKTDSMNTALLVEQGLSDAPDFDTAKAGLRKKGFSYFGANAEDHVFYWIPGDNVVVLYSQESQTVVYPEDYEAQSLESEWRLLSEN